MVQKNLLIGRSRTRRVDNQQLTTPICANKRYNTYKRLPGWIWVKVRCRRFRVYNTIISYLSCSLLHFNHSILINLNTNQIFDSWDYNGERNTCFHTIYDYNETFYSLNIINNTNEASPNAKFICSSITYENHDVKLKTRMFVIQHTVYIRHNKTLGNQVLIRVEKNLTNWLEIPKSNLEL